MLFFYHEPVTVPPVFQIASDVHVEFFRDIDPIEIEPSAPYLILAGDIGVPSKDSYRQLLERESKRFQKVFVIAGNHEYYSGEYHSTKRLLHSICSSFPNVFFMDKTSMWLPESQVRVLGTTLWSHVPDENKVAVSRSLNDYAMIRLATDDSETRTRKLTVDDTNAWFQDEAAWLNSEISAAKAAQEKVIVITHHAPLTEGTSDPKFDGSECNCAFSSDMRSFLGAPVKTWVFGHTHYSSDRIVNGTRVLSNQLGYKLFRENSGYRNDFTVKVD